MQNEIREKLIEFLSGKSIDTAEDVEAVADHLIANGVTVQEWISVKDRLPEECGVFLVCGNRGGIYTAEFRKFGNFGGEYPHWHKLNSTNHRCEPTHWMPLPQPPKGE